MNTLLELEPTEFAQLSNVPTYNHPTWWHVNNHIRITTSDRSLPTVGAFSGIVDMKDLTNVLILQRADASTEWLLLAFKEGEMTVVAHTETPDASDHTIYTNGDLPDVTVEEHTDSADDVEL